MRSGIFASLIGVWVIIAVGCGGGEDSSLTKAEFTKQANAVCKSGFERKNRMMETAVNRATKRNGGRPLGLPELAKIAGHVALPQLHLTADQLAALHAPKGDDAKVDAMLQDFNAGIAKVENEIAQVLEGKVEDPFNMFRQSASALGLSQCLNI